MSNSSGETSGTANGRQRIRTSGVPKKCVCGASIVAIMSRSAANPYRRYFRCSYAASLKLIDDNHTFKWVDEAMLDEIEALAIRTTGLEQTVTEMTTQCMDNQKLVFERLQIKLEKEILERVEDELMESKSSMKKMMIGVVVGCMIMVGLGIVIA